MQSLPSLPGDTSWPADVLGTYNRIRNAYEHAKELLDLKEGQAIQLEVAAAQVRYMQVATNAMIICRVPEEVVKSIELCLDQADQLLWQSLADQEAQ